MPLDDTADVLGPSPLTEEVRADLSMADPMGDRPADVVEHAADLDKGAVEKGVVASQLESQSRDCAGVPDHPCIAADRPEQGFALTHARAMMR